MHLWKQLLSAEDEVLSLGNLFTAPQLPVTVLSSFHQSTLLHFPWKHSCDISAPSIHFTTALCTAETPNFLWVWFSTISGYLSLVDGSGWKLWASGLGVVNNSTEIETDLIQLTISDKKGVQKIMKKKKGSESDCTNFTQLTFLIQFLLFSFSAAFTSSLLMLLVH